MLLQQSAAYLILSLLAVFFAKYVHMGIIYFDMLYTYLNLSLSSYIEGTWVRNIIIMVLLPLGLAGIPALIYRLIKKQNMPYFLPLTWFLWLVFVLSNVLIQ